MSTKQTRSIMGMPITVEILDTKASTLHLEQVFNYFSYIDGVFSTYKSSSEISKINRGELPLSHASFDIQEVFRLAEETKLTTKGFFNIQRPDGKFDPSGLVKGWAIDQAAKILRNEKLQNFYIEAGGDIQVSGKNENEKKWRVGIQNPFNLKEIIKVVYLDTQGIATTGTYQRGQHIYNPISQKTPQAWVSLTVIGANVYEADRFATAAFAMDEKGMDFIESLPGFEAYAVTKEGVATVTSGFDVYTIDEA